MNILKMMVNTTKIACFSLLLAQCIGNGQQHYGDSDLTELAKWSIDEGVLQQTTFQKKGSINQSAEAAKLWNKIRELLPHKLVNQYVKEFEFITDGPDELLAAVKPMDDTNKRWTLGIDPADVPKGDWRKEKDFLHTLIHEFGHILTLNDTQVEPSDLEYQADERRYLTMEGLAYEQSIINQFIQKFWYINNRIEDWDKINRIKNENKKLNKLYDFYLANPTVFHTDYAAESPEEDIAESWYFFVVSDRPKGDLEKDQKILFFYNFEELVALRTEIRSAIR